MQYLIIQDQFQFLRSVGVSDLYLRQKVPTVLCAGQRGLCGVVVTAVCCVQFVDHFYKYCSSLVQQILSKVAAQSD